MAARVIRSHITSSLAVNQRHRGIPPLHPCIYKSTFECRNCCEDDMCFISLHEDIRAERPSRRVWINGEMYIDMAESIDWNIPRAFLYHEGKPPQEGEPYGKN